MLKLNQKVTEKTTATKIQQNTKKKSNTIYQLYMVVTSNNVLFSITTTDGKPRYTYSAGKAGFKSHQKKNLVALHTTGYQLGQKLQSKDINNINVIFKGIKTGRKDALQGLYKSGLKIHSFIEESPIPHNGCRRQKQRRV